MNDDQYRKYAARVRDVASAIVDKVLAENNPYTLSDSDDLRFWIHFELIRRLSHRLLVSNYAACAVKALDYLQKENAELVRLTGGNWVPEDYLRDFQTETATSPEFRKAVWPNSVVTYNVNGVWERLGLEDDDGVCLTH